MADSHRYPSDTLSHRPFQVLKKEAYKKSCEAGSCPGGTKKEDGLTDEELFLQEMKKVREIREFREIPVRPKGAVLSGKRPVLDENPVEILHEIVHGKRGIHLPDTQEYVEWMEKDCNPELVKRLHTGSYAVQDSLDLHGYTLEEAEREIDTFMRGSLRHGFRCLKIVHGRGLRSQNGPVLKTSTVKLLSTRYRKSILAFVSARQCDGGLGALYILLRV